MPINALAAHEPKALLKPYAYETDQLSPDEIVLQITHCGICHSDIHLIDNDWTISKYPFVPGHEIVGIITETGNRVSGLEAGQRVGVGWQSGSCHTCEWCASGQENLCPRQIATCVGRHGGFAEKVRTDYRFAFPIPDNLDSENAAPLLCAGITVYSPLKQYGVRHHHRVGVVGIGGLGHVALQFARAMGCEVTAFSSTPEKEPEARAFGADHFVNVNDKQAMKISSGKLDFILSTVTAPLNWSAFISALRPNGRLCFVGASVGNLNVPVGSFVMGQKSVSGSVIGGRAIMNEMLEFAARHQVKAKTELMPLNAVNTAIEKVRNNQARYRMVLSCSNQ